MREGEGTRLEPEAPGQSIQIVVMKLIRSGNKLFPLQECRAEMDLSVFDKNPQFTQATKNVFLDLPGQPRLAGASLGRRVRISIQGKRAILAGDLQSPMPERMS